MIGYELLLPVVTSFLIVTPVVLALVSFCVLVGLAGIPWVRGRPSWLLFLGVLLTLGIALFTYRMYLAIDTSARPTPPALAQSPVR